MATPIRHVIAPEPFTGEGSWDYWIDDFESVAAVNKWEDAQKLLWIRVRMTGRAQKAYKNLSEEAKGSYGLCKKGLRERFEPASKKELYQSEFHVRRKRRIEEWAAFAEDLKILADRAFPDLQEEAKEHLALTHYLGQLENPQVAFGVKQRRPKTVDEAVTVTLELESYHRADRASRPGSTGHGGRCSCGSTDQERSPYGDDAGNDGAPGETGVRKESRSSTGQAIPEGTSATRPTKRDLGRSQEDWRKDRQPA